jgi:hypothetical protein
MKLNGRDIAVDDDHPEVMDITVQGVAQKQPLDHMRKTVDPIEDGAQIIDQCQQDVIQIRSVLEKDETGTQYQTDPDIEDHQTQNRIDQKQEVPAEGNMIKNTQNKENTQCQTEIDQTGYIIA